MHISASRWWPVDVTPSVCVCVRVCVCACVCVCCVCVYNYNYNMEKCIYVFLCFVMISWYHTIHFLAYICSGAGHLRCWQHLKDLPI